jgi:FixJ family two-component response regulator
VQIYSSAEQFLDQQPNDDRSGCLLLDVRIPGLSGPELQGRLLPTIECAIVRHNALRKIQSELDVLRAHVAALTPRERQVFGLVVHGKINKQIAFALGSTERTIKAHRQRVMEKMNVRSLAELVLIAARLGLSPAVATPVSSISSKVE